MISRKHIVLLAVTVLAALAVLSSCSADPQKAKQRYLQSGVRYIESGKYEQAILQFQNAIKLDPRFAEAFYQMSKAYLANRDAQRSFNALRQAIDLAPNRPEFHLDIGQLYVSGGMYSDAQEEASLVLSKDPSNGAAFQLLGVSLAAQLKTEQALDAFTKAVQLQPANASAYVDLGLAELSLKRYDAAEQHLRRALELDPHSVNVYNNLANFYRLRGRMPDAVLTLHLGVTNNPDVPSMYLTWAEFLYAMQNRPEADSALNQLRTRQPKSAAVALLIGDFYSARQETDKAVADYRRGLQLDSKNAEIQNHIVDCYLSAGRLKEAAEVNDQVRKRLPKDVFAGIARGRILLGQGKRDEAISELQRVVTQARDSAQAHYFLGLAYWQNQNLPQAKTELQDALSFAPDLTPIKHSLAELRLALGELADACQLAEQLVAKNPSDAGERLLLGKVYLRQKEPAKARQQFLEARIVAPRAVELAIAMAQSYADERKWPEAEKELESVLKEQPNSLSALESLINIWTGSNQRPKAIARMESYVRQNPSAAEAHALLGKLYLEGSQVEAAKAEFFRAIQLDATLINAHALLGAAYQNEGKIDAAIQEFENVLQAQPRTPYIHTLAADLYRKQNNREMARRHYEQALAIAPDFILAINNLAWMYAAEGTNLDVALGLAQKAKQLQPDSLNSTDTLAWIQYKKGLYAAAIPLLQECVAKEPHSAAYQYHLGMALLAHGERQKGKQYVETALRLKLAEPDAQDARRALGQSK